MSKLTLEIVTGERLLHQDTDIDQVQAPGALGELGILPNHAPLVTALQSGPLVVKKGGDEFAYFVSGGFLEVNADTVTVLADSAERGDEIDLERAEQARRRAEERLQAEHDVDRARAEAALQRSLMRLKVSERWRRQRPTRPPGMN